ncbi:MAG: YtoQ family protein [Cyclobacteriaceae bacterium]|nr:YtoQ family protein [Cyclobacteriaceae bacterium]
MIDLTVFLSGEIHTAWRNEVVSGCENEGFLIDFISPVTDHDASDSIGEEVLGKEDNPFWKDHKAAKINSIRIKTGLERADVVVIKFGEKYKQWNAAFDAGYAAAMGKPYIVIHPPEFTHALKEVDAQAMAVAENVQQAIEILKYVALKK